jgi:hypothetical protein
VNIFQIRVDYGMISLRRRFKKDLRAMDIREMELMKGMLLLLQRARGRRKEFPGGTLVKSNVIVVTSWGTLLLSVLRRRRRRNRRGLIQLLHQL